MSFAIVAAATVIASPGGRADDARLTIQEARTYLVELVNRDRAAKGLKPVELDPIATAAGQKHAEEMATGCFLAHWNREGKLPDQRYTEAGGQHRVSENVYLTFRYGGASPPDVLDLSPDQTFSRREIEAIEEAYFNEVPPNDGHRRNILEPEHTHVGIALARAVWSDSASTVANTQEFVDRYLEMDPLPIEAKVGQTIVVSGRSPAGIEVRGVSLARESLPTMKTRDELVRTGHYGAPAPFLFARQGDRPDHHVVTYDTGRFECRLALTDDGKPGIYFVSVLARGRDGRTVTASRRTIVVR